MNRKFISKSNRVLRKILNSEQNIDILQDFIEAFLNIKIKKIVLNPYLEKNSKHLPSEENFGIADVRITKQDGSELNVGIQIIDGLYIQNKLLIYYAQIHTNQLEYGENRAVAKTVTINILDCNYFKTDEYHKKILIQENVKDKSLAETIELHVLELPKFYRMGEKKLTKEEAWTSYLRGILDDDIVKYDKIQKLDNLLNKYWEEEIME